MCLGVSDGKGERGRTLCSGERICGIGGMRRRGVLLPVGVDQTCRLVGMRKVRRGKRERMLYSVVFFIKEMNHADVVLERYDVGLRECFHRRHVCPCCFEGAETVFGEADRIELMIVRYAIVCQMLLVVVCTLKYVLKRRFVV